MDTPSIPDRPDAVTAAWLDGVLTTDGTVARVDVLDQHAGTTGRLRLRLAYDAPGPDDPETVFVKLAPFDEDQRGLVAMTDMGRTEARFYEQLAATTPMRVPRCHFAAHDGRTDYIMVLEDLEAAGCRFTSRTDDTTATQVDGLVTGLARVHAHHWEDPRFADELAWVRPPGRGELGAQLVAKARETFRADLPPEFVDLCDLFVDHHDAIGDLWDAGPVTLIHGDCHSGNQFLDGDEVGLYDWAVISRSPGVRDLAIFLGNSCPTEMRRAGEDGWLRAYRDTLVAAGVDAPSLDDLWLGYRRTVLYAWVAATATAAMGDKWQPIEVGIAGMTRATRACADLDTIEALRSGF